MNENLTAETGFHLQPAQQRQEEENTHRELMNAHTTLAIQHGAMARENEILREEVRDQAERLEYLEREVFNLISWRNRTIRRRGGEPEVRGQ